MSSPLFKSPGDHLTELIIIGYTMSMSRYLAGANPTKVVSAKANAHPKFPKVDACTTPARSSSRPLSSASVSGLDASVNKPNAGSPLHPLRHPRMTRSCWCHSLQALGASVRHNTPWNWHCSRTVLLLLFLPRTKFCSAAFSKNAFPYAKYTYAISGTSSACVCDLARLSK